MKLFNLRISLILISAGVLFSFNVNAQPFSLARTQQLEFNSKITEMKHQLVVSIPESYASSPKQYYPTLYFLDAYWDTPLVYATVSNLGFDRQLPELVLVGLSLPEGTAKTAFRDRYFSPTVKHGEPDTGHAATFYKMLTQEVAPFIESQYRAQSYPGGRALAGQSMGGLFSLFALYQTPRFYSRFIAINPAVSWNTQFLLNLDRNNAKQFAKHPARLFVSYGENEFAPFRDATVQLIHQLQHTPHPGLSLKTHKLLSMYHTGGKGEAYARGLMWTLGDLAPAGKSGLELIWK